MTSSCGYSMIGIPIVLKAATAGSGRLAAGEES
jgi:hypothetical protein